MFPPTPVGIWPPVSTRRSIFLFRFLYSVLHPTDPRFADLEPPTPHVHYSDVQTVNISISVKLWTREAQIDVKSDYRTVGEYPGRFIISSATTTYAAVQSVSCKPFRSPEWVWIYTGPAVKQRPSYTQCDNDRSAQTVALTLRWRPSPKAHYLSYCVLSFAYWKPVTCCIALCL